MTLLVDENHHYIIMFAVYRLVNGFSAAIRQSIAGHRIFLFNCHFLQRIIGETI